MRHQTRNIIDRLRAWATAPLLRRVESLEKGQATAMGQLEDLNAQVIGLQSDVAALQARVKAHEDADAAQIAALNATIAQLQSAAAPDLTATIAALQAVRASIQTTDPAPAQAVTPAAP